MPHVLLVEDDPEVGALMRASLHESGIRYRISCLTTGKQALDLVARDRPDGAVIDVLLPDISGIDVAAAAMAYSVPVLMTTGLPDLCADIRRLGLPCLAKPFRMEVLVAETVRLTLHRGEIMRALAGQLERLQRNRRELRDLIERRGR